MSFRGSHPRGEMHLEIEDWLRRRTDARYYGDLSSILGQITGRGHEGGHEQVVRATKRLEGIGPPRLRLGPAELPGGSRPPSLLAIDRKCAEGVARTSLSR